MENEPTKEVAEKDGPDRRLVGLIAGLCALPNETGWLEFKTNNCKPDKIGETISALANGAALANRARGYMLWGVDDKTHEIVGTTFDPANTKGAGNEDLEPWLIRGLTPQLDLRFREATFGDLRVVLLDIPAASTRPVQFKGVEYIRVGSYVKLLGAHPEKARALWRLFDAAPFEIRPALEGVSDENVLALLDHGAYFTLTKTPQPAGRAKVLEALEHERLIRRSDSGWDITNLGAILFARRLELFPTVSRKAPRLIQYKGPNRLDAVHEKVWLAGYACAFQQIMDLVATLVPVNEAFIRSVRAALPMYPLDAVRELIANALIHQDLAITGTGPVIELFSDRLEVSNPGKSLVEAERLLDKAPKSRNEALAWLMRRIGVCEERGSGVDRVVALVEAYQLPAPLFLADEDSMRVTLFGQRPLPKMEAKDRIRACYQHACLKWVQNETLTNTSVRERFGLAESESPAASRLIKEAVEAGAIVPVDPDASKRHMKYVPIWAAPKSASDAAASG